MIYNISNIPDPKKIELTMSKIHSKYGGSSTEGHGLNQICFLRFRHCLNLDIGVGVLVVFDYEVCVYQVDCLRFQYRESLERAMHYSIE